MDALRVITLNTAKCDGPYTERVLWLAEEASELRPDIFACQEVFREDSGALDTFSTLQKALQTDGAWAPARYKQRVTEGRHVTGWSGMALFSTRPWAYIDVLDLPSDPLDGDRVAQVGLLELERFSVVVANVHLTHLRDADHLWRRQIESVLEHPLMQMKQALRVICGDFNSLPESRLMQELLDSKEHGSLRDAYVIGGGQPDRATLPPRDVSVPGRCVDYILSVAASADTHPLFTSSTVTFKRRHASRGILPSDHYGVACTLVPARIHGWLRQEQAVV
jgi:endonuclease/exonuclease/phosphatase family metal-dependent hydrolase